MRRFLASEIGAAVMWVVGSLLFAAAMAPWLYQGGKWLAGVAAENELPALVEWLAASCGRAKFGRFFDRALLLSALLLLPVLLARIRVLRVGAAGLREFGAVRSRGCGGIEWAMGFLVAVGTLGSLCFLLHGIGASVPRDPLPGLGKVLAKVLVPAIGASMLEEWLFRGVLIGLWLRFSRPAAACAGSAVVFAILHFLKPPAGMVIDPPDHPFAGYQLLGLVVSHYVDPRFLLADFATLVAVGLVLGWARLKTGALWLSMGLHAGWIVIFKASGLFYHSRPGHLLRPWAVGENLRSGVLPLLTLGLAALLCRWLLERVRCSSQPRMTVST